MRALDKPRAAWVMVPAAITGEVVDQLAELTRARRRHHRRRQQLLPRRHRAREQARRPGIHYIDCGTSGGVFGLERGFCLMIGGDAEPVAAPRPDLPPLAPGVAAAPPHAGARGRRHRRARLPALRPRRRRPLREDGPQRHRVRHHGRLRRGPEHPAPGERRQGAMRRRRRDRAAERPGVLPVRHRRTPRSPSCGGAAA